MACGGGIIVEDPKNIEALAPDVATFEFDLHGKNGPLSIILQPVCVLTLGEPLNSTSCDDPLLAFMLPNLISQFLINQQGFDVDFGERGRMMACSWVYCTGERGQSVQKSRRTILF